MKKILLSLGTLALVGAVVAGVTIAYYNDTETSSGNIFVAGSIDLKVDHLKQTYNDMNCETCSLEMFSSDGLNEVTQASAGADYTGILPKTAVEVANPHNNWVDEITGHPQVKWVWVDDATSAHDAGNVEVEYTFERDFYWNGVPGEVNFEMALASDNGYAIYVNNTPLIDHLADEYNYNATVQPLNALQAQFKNALVLGNNTLKIIVRNHAQVGGTPSSNPGGLLYYLSIENTECENDLGFQQACRLWIEKDLEDGDTFFNFGDIKPADWGTNVISLHVFSNEAYACLIVNNKDDQENEIYDPEATAGDLPDVGNPNGFGELSNYINVFTWGDVDGDGVYDAGEIPLGNGSLASLSSIMSMDSVSAQSLPANTTKYIGLAWCAGTLSAVEGQPFACDGSGMPNIAQSDSFTADLTAYAEQVRNNGTFSCDNVPLSEYAPLNDAVD